jgi:hypothetical protein
VDDLRGQLDIFEGKANPFEYWLWPPKRDAPPRRNIVARVFDQSSETFAAALRGGKYDRAQRARGYLGLALLAKADGRAPEARRYYEHARDELTALREQQSDQQNVARALADCHLRLAELAQTNDAAAAAKDRETARLIYRSLAAQHAAEPVEQVEWLEAEMISAMGTDGESQAAHLKRVADINRALAEKWPIDPDALYRLACFLTAQELLIPASNATDSSGTSVTGNSAGEATDAVND